MRKFTKRLTKKYCKRVADGLWDDTITPFYARKVQMICQHYFDHKYLTVFRPWYWEQDWKTLNLVEEHEKHFKAMSAELQKKTGIHLGMLNSYLKDIPKRRRGKRKPRNKKEQSIRKLRNPQGYKIHVREVGGKHVWHDIIAELAFSHKGYDFFICHYNGLWTVSDVTAGRRIYASHSYKLAIKTAREYIEENFDKYVEQVKKLA